MFHSSLSLLNKYRTTDGLVLIAIENGKSMVYPQKVMVT